MRNCDHKLFKDRVELIQDAKKIMIKQTSFPLGKPKRNSYIIEGIIALTLLSYLFSEIYSSKTKTDNLNNMSNTPSV